MTNSTRNVAPKSDAKRNSNQCDILGRSNKKRIDIVSNTTIKSHENEQKGDVLRKPNSDDQQKNSINVKREEQANHLHSPHRNKEDFSVPVSKEDQLLIKGSMSPSPTSHQEHKLHSKTEQLGEQRGTYSRSLDSNKVSKSRLPRQKFSTLHVHTIFVIISILISGYNDKQVKQRLSTKSRKRACGLSIFIALNHR